MGKAGMPKARVARGSGISIEAVALRTWLWPTSNSPSALRRTDVRAAWLRIRSRFDRQMRHAMNGNAREPRTKKLAIAGK